MLDLIGLKNPPENILATLIKNSHAVYKKKLNTKSKHLILKKMTCIIAPFVRSLIIALYFLN